jgi:UDP-3-O-[3-hydroxymyristoyl] glucosamine N-acyltransferase
MRAARPGIHPTAVVDKAAQVDASAEIGAYVVVEAGAEIGVGCRIGSFVSIGEGVTIGADCRIGAHASISHALLGSRVYIYPGARIGQEGFSFAATKTGFLSIPQLGRVIVEDDVEVGANSTIDRGSTRDTIIGAGTRIDNLVQIGHNVRLGRCCVIVAQVGIAGSTVLEDFVQVGGQAAMAGHLHVGRGTQIGAQAGVISDVAAGSILLGSPARPRAEFFRQVATLKRISRRPK